MINLHIEANDAADLRRQLTELLGPSDTQLIAQAEYAKPPLADSDEPKRRGRPPKAETTQPAADTSTESQAQTEAGAANAAAEVSDDAPIAYETHIKPAILKVSTDLGGREAVLKLLSDFDVNHASKLTEAQWPALLARVAEMEAA